MDFTEAQRMLCLAALTYQRFDEMGPPQLDAMRLDAAVRRGLDDLAPLAGQWELAWGPEAYRAPFSLFDDAAMFVVRAVGRPGRYVIAIRGTNPLSGFDWLLGDLWVAKQLDWPYGDSRRSPGAKISLSTALGLSILQHLRSRGPDTGLVSRVWRFVDDELSRITSPASALIEQIAHAVNGRLRHVQLHLWRALAELKERRLARSRRDHRTQLARLQEEWSSGVLERVFRGIDDVADAVGGEDRFDLLALLQDEAALRTSLRPGHDLLTFLKAAVAVADDEVDVVVTGHSKGGALASTVALWLADTQGEATVPEQSRWDPRRKATVRCFSFAGPTAGNAAFAQRSDAIIGPRCHRIANALDVVPQAWAPDDLREIPTLYSDRVVPIPGLPPLLNAIASVVEPLGYRHVGREVTELRGTLDAGRHDFFDQLVHQHLDGYLRAMELGSLVNTWTFFDPLV